MDRNPSVNIYKLIRSLGIDKHKKRQEFLVKLMKGMIKARSVLFSEIADKIDHPIEVESIERRIQDFFKKVSFDYDKLLLFFLGLIHHDRLQLSIDRTEWDFGKTQINILCVVASIGKMGVPLYFEMLENNSGNSGHADRISLFQNLIALLGKDRISVLIMDREFIGWSWLSWLKKEEIPFCVRVPKHHKITLIDGRIVKAEDLLKGRKSYYASNVIVDQTLVNLSLSYDYQGELMYLIGTLPPTQLKATYRRRWPIEVFFQALKGRGFNLEESRLRNVEKYKKLFAVASMAYTLCWATGIESGRRKPVKTKKHGYPQFSVFRRGLNLIRKFFKTHICPELEQILSLALQKLPSLVKTVG